MEITLDAFGKICRACLCESTNMKSLFMTIDGEDRSLLDVLRNVTNVNIKSDDKLPKLVCNECETMMCKAEVFKKRCLESEVILKNISGETGPNIEDVETDLKRLIKDEKKYSILRNLLDIPADISNEATNEDIDVKMTILDNTSNNVNCKGSFDKTIEMPISEDVLQIENNVKEEVSEDFQHNDDNSFTDEPSLLIEIPVEIKPKTEDETEWKYSCHCGLNFVNKEKYKMHLKVFNCNKFNKLLKRITDSNSIQIKNQISCQKCKREFSTVSAWNAHQHVHRDETKSAQYFQCSVCMCKFKHRKTLVRHMSKHNESNAVRYHCDKCKREFKFKAHLENHIISVHSQNGFTCDYCMQCFNDKESLEVHRDKHQANKKHQCEVCKKTFYMLCTLKDHMRTHTGEKPFLCSVCGKGFSQKTNLGQHMRRHQGLKPYKCESCEKRFVSKGELDAHARTHSGAHPFVCDECGNGFTTSSSLVKHRRIHTGERPYICDLCPMRFSASGTLKNHRRTHTGERPFQCSYCEKAFVQRNDLISHIRCHTGERPFVCTLCGQSFRKASGLKAHGRVHSAVGLRQEREDMRQELRDSARMNVHC